MVYGRGRRAPQYTVAAQTTHQANCIHVAPTVATPHRRSPNSEVTCPVAPPSDKLASRPASL